MSRARGTWIAAAAGSVLLGISFYALITWLEQGQLSDVGGYQQHATAIRAGLYYRMETVRPISASSFEWPSDVRRPLRISSAASGTAGST